MIKCIGLATKWYRINQDIFANCLIIMAKLICSPTYRYPSLLGVIVDWEDKHDVFK